MVKSRLKIMVKKSLPDVLSRFCDHLLQNCAGRGGRRNSWTVNAYLAFPQQFTGALVYIESTCFTAHPKLGHGRFHRNGHVAPDWRVFCPVHDCRHGNIAADRDLREARMDGLVTQAPPVSWFSGFRLCDAPSGVLRHRYGRDGSYIGGN